MYYYCVCDGKKTLALPENCWENWFSKKRKAEEKKTDNNKPKPAKSKRTPEKTINIGFSMYFRTKKHIS